MRQTGHSSSRRTSRRDRRTVSLEDFAGQTGPAVDEAYAALTPKTVAKYMLTSGSTGEPKAVINLHGMVAANAKMIRSVWN